METLGNCQEDQGWGLLSFFCSILLFNQIFRIIKTSHTCWIPHTYLPGATTAELWWHLSNMNEIRSIWQILLGNRKFLWQKKLTNKALTTPTLVMEWSPSLVLLYTIPELGYNSQKLALVCNVASNIHAQCMIGDLRHYQLLANMLMG